MLRGRTLLLVELEATLANSPYQRRSSQNTFRVSYLPGTISHGVQRVGVEKGRSILQALLNNSSDQPLIY